MAAFLVSLIFFVLLIFSVIMGVSQASMLASWISLELNMLVFIALMSLTFSKLETNSMKYFIVQSVGSSLFLGAVSLSLVLSPSSSLGGAISGSLILKLGAAPLHSWFIGLLSEVSWEVFFMASTLQKVLPFYLISHNHCILLTVVISLSALVSVAGSMNQMLLKKLLGYSSVFGTAWMLACGSAFSVGIQFLAAYSLSLILVVSIFSVLRMNSVNSKFVQGGPASMLLFMLSLLSLGGSPPFVGFYAKAVVMQEMLVSGQFFWIAVLIPSAVFMLYIYMRLFYSALSNWESAVPVPHQNRIVLFSVAVLFGSIPGLFWLLRLGVTHSSFWTFSS